MAAMRHAYTEELDSLFYDLADMSARIETMISEATLALLSGDARIAEAVISADHEIDSARERIEESAFTLLSTQQPVAGDLRTLVSALRMVSELERMGDLSVHVAKIARLRVPNIAVPQSVRPIITRMASLAGRMTGEASHIIRERDLVRAADMETTDEEMDSLRRSSFNQLLSAEWDHGVEAAVDLALLGRYYERIADHAVSVSRRVVFTVTGEKNFDATA